MNKSGIGLRMEADWRGATRVTGITAKDELRFAGSLVLNMRLFGNIEHMVPTGQNWTRSMRISFDVRNLLNNRPAVILLADGTTPLAYQPAYLEALGRTIRISLRKQF